MGPLIKVYDDSRERKKSTFYHRYSGEPEHEEIKEEKSCFSDRDEIEVEEIAFDDIGTIDIPMPIDPPITLPLVISPVETQVLMTEPNAKVSDDDLKILLTRHLSMTKKDIKSMV